MESLTNNNIEKKNQEKIQNTINYQSNFPINPIKEPLPEDNILGKTYENEENYIKNNFNLFNIFNLELNEKSLNKKNENLIVEQPEILYIQFISYIKGYNTVKNIEKIEKILKENPNFINKISYEGLSPLQYSILFSDVYIFKKLIEYKANTKVIVEGMHIIHLSLVMCIFKKEQKRCSEIFHYIIEKFPEQKDLVDRLGRTYLHMIFQYDFTEALSGINILIDELFKIDNNGDYVINYVYKYNSKNSFTYICQNFINLKEIYLKIREESKLNKGLYYQREEVFLENCLIHHAYEIIGFIVLNCFGFDLEVKTDLERILVKYSKYIDNQEEGIYGINSIYYNAYIAYNGWDFIHSKNNSKREQYKFDFKFLVRKTGIIYNNNCLLHLELPEEPIKRIRRINELKENSNRFSLLISDKKTGILNNDLFDDPIQFIIKESTRESCLNDILKCHDITYLQNIKTKCDNISKKNSLNLINNNNNLKDENTKYKTEKLNSDTYISKNTFNIMTSTIGSIFDAIDLVISGECTNAFVIIRPPGHNAGYFGTFENNLNNSNNCIINNACIGAAYARYKYRDNGISKIAIFDYNAFCGKGSEEIIEMLNSKVFSKDMNYDKVGKINIRKDKKINWLNFSDAKNILYISTHIQENDSFGNIINNTKENDEIYPAGILNIPFNTKKIYSYDFRNVIRSKVIPRLCKFKPDLIILCSGFDGHELEENDNQMFLQEYDYAFLTEQLQFVADHYSKKMIVSILEEGYNVKSGIISSFAQSVFTHVRYLNLAANMSYIFDVKLKKDERKREYENDLENFKKIERFKNVNIIENKNDKRIEKEEDVDWDTDNNFNINKNYSHNKNVNYKNISDVPKNLIKRKKNKSIS